MATLYEIGLEYERSAEPLRQRLKELRQALAAADPEEAWRIKQRIKELTPLLTECNKLARFCKRYYERGYYINNGAFSIERTGRTTNAKPPALQGVAVHYEKRTNTATAASVRGMSNGRENLYGICKTKGSKQVHRISELLQRAREAD